MVRTRSSPSRSHDSATVGAVAEASLLCLLLSNGFEVFKPMIDVGSDFLAISPSERVLWIQCKGRGRDKAWLWDIRRDQLDKRHPPTHYFFIHGAPQTKDCWLVPADTVRKAWAVLGKGKARVTLTEANRKLLQPYREEAGIREAMQWAPP